MKLPNNWDLPESIQVRFGQSHGQQRAMVEDDHLLLILHRLPKWGERQREGVLFWREPAGEWQFAGRGNGLPALRKHVKEYAEAEADLLTRYEGSSTAADYFNLLESLAPVRQAAANLKNALQNAREDIPHDRDLIALRDDAADVARNFDLLYESSKNALDFEMAQEAERQARLSKQSIQVANRLNVIAAVFLPLTAIAGIFGMNMTNGLPKDSPALFWAIFIGGLFFGFILRGWVLSRPSED